MGGCTALSPRSKPARDDRRSCFFICVRSRFANHRFCRLGILVVTIVVLDEVPQDTAMHGFSESQPLFEPRHRGGRPLWFWLLVGTGLVVILSCGGIVVWAMYIGTVGPDTSVYTGNQVPARFTNTMRSVGALDDDETIFYFYSDAMSDIRGGFYFVSDKKVVIYSESAGGVPLTVVQFDEIADVDLYRNESFFEDSQITLELKDGRPISFPVSSELDRDQRFFDTIKSRVSGLSSSG